MYILYMSSEMSVTSARDELGPMTSRVEYAGETVYLTKHGRRVAGVVPAAAAELLEELEDVFDIEAVRAAMANVAAGGDAPEPFVRRTRRRDAQGT
jgi:prevent-host-death family protein